MHVSGKDISSDTIQKIHSLPPYHQHSLIRISSQLPTAFSRQHILEPQPPTAKMQLLSSILSFDESQKLRVHITQIILIVLAIILSIARVTIRNPPATRANTVAITMVLSPNPTQSTIYKTTEKHTPILTPKNQTGHQIPHRNRLPTPHRAPRPLPQMGQHKSECHPQ
jgi:hypothetical protein